MKDNFPHDTSKFRLIVSDYDGTLVGRDHVLSEKLLQSVKRWQDSGRLFTLATARSYFMIKKICEDLHITTPMVVRGGAEIVDPKSGDVLHSSYIQEEHVKAFLELVKQQNLTILIEKDNNIYTRYDVKKKFPLVNYLDIDEFVVSEIPKMVVYLDDTRIAESEAILEGAKDIFPSLNIVKSYLPERKAWDITSINATKNTMLLKLFQLLNMEREVTVGVGDGYNDFSLLEACGLKVAMGNANDELKEIADVIVPSYEEDGVAYLIEKLLEKNNEL